MLEIHKDARNSSVVPYHKFLNRYKAASCEVYGFVEGKDDPSFYKGIIESCLPNGWDIELIQAGEKDNVLKALNVIDWSRFSKKRVCFFVDRDLSEFLHGEQLSSQNLYITDNYSIENDAITFGTMRRVLEEVLNVTELNSIEIRAIKELFQSNLRIFQEAMTIVMSQIVIWRRNVEDVNLNNIQLNKIFKFIDGKIILEDGFIEPISRVEYAAKCFNVVQSTIDELKTVETEFRAKQGVEKFIRGKYLMWFFVECALKTHSAIPKFCTNHSTSPKMRLSLGFSNAMITIAPRVRCPESLKCFIKRNYLEHIQEAQLVA